MVQPQMRRSCSKVVNADGSAFDDVFLTSAGASHSLFLKKNGSDGR